MQGQYAWHLVVDAENVLARQSFEILKSTVQVRRPSQLKGSGKPVPMPRASPAQVSNQKESGTFDTIKVTPVCKKDESTVLLYFENEKRSGGGTIAQFRMISDKKKALICFQDPKG